MLSILLTILKVLGIVLLVLLGLILALLLTVLLVPVRYSGHVLYREKLSSQIRAGWLLGLVKFLLEYDQREETGPVWSLRIFGKKILPREMPAAEEIPEEGSSEDAVPEEKPPASDVPEEPPQVTAPETAAPEGTEKTEPGPKEPAPEQSADTGTPREDNKDKKDKKEKKSLAEKIRELPELLDRKLADLRKRFLEKRDALLEKLAGLRERKDRIEALLRSERNQRTFRMLLRQIKKLLQHLLPRQWKGEVILGFEDPATTGQVLAWLAVFLPLYGTELKIIPDMEQQIIDADVDMNGRIRLIVPVAIAVRILADPGARSLYREVKNV